MKFYISLFSLLFSVQSFAQIKIKIDPTSDKKPISPYIYGRNNSFSSTNPNWALSNEEFIKIRDAGVTFFRESGGNNCTKYNWRRKLSSHPDWYNNVYTNDWDKTAQNIQKNFPAAQGMWAFQLLGKAAKTNVANFNDWGYNKSQWWEGVNQNLAGNGVLNPTGKKAKVEGDTNLYLENWNADSTTAILDYWFKNLGLNRDKIQYWNMDNEAEIWSGTHDDVMPKQLSAEDFIQKYVEVAKKAKAKYPNIKLVGPVTANEWQWYNWDNNAISHEGRNYPWLEFFIKRIADEQKKSNIKLLDVLDIHFYPSTKKNEEIVQLHRVFFDRNYVFPEANGVKRVNGGWDNNQNKEYIFGRINDWLEQYFGKNHGIKLGLTEIGIESADANATAVWYASTMGEFMKNEVEIFTPWSWKVGMWETLHLFSKYNKSYSVKSTSSNEELVSAYPSINSRQDSMTVVLVNRSSSNQSILLGFDNYIINSTAKSLTLKSLTNTETFISDTQNALAKTDLNVFNNELSINLSGLSVTSVLLTGKVGNFVATVLNNEIEEEMKIFPNPVYNQAFSIDFGQEKYEFIEIFDIKGKSVFSTNQANETVVLPKEVKSGVYFMKIRKKDKILTKKLMIE